jgi:sirohydrochlorin cobaltochelatase
MSQGLILLAHGARDPNWAAPVEAVAARIRRRRPALPLRLAYLDFMTPDLNGAVAQLAAAGCARVSVLPMFLGSGGHVRKDLPALLDALRQRHPALRLTLHAAVGEIDGVMQAMADAALATLPDGAAPLTHDGETLA